MSIVYVYVVYVYGFCYNALSVTDRKSKGVVMAMQRVQVLITDEQKAKAARLAKGLNVKPAEIYRRAMDAYVPELEQYNGELEVLADTLKEACDRASQALDQAETEVTKTLTYYRKRRQ